MASPCFTNPGEPALRAEVFWRVEDYQRVLSAYVRRCDAPGFGSVVALGDLRCRKTLLRMPDGTQHLLLRDRKRVVQLHCVGAEIDANPFALEIVLDGFPNVEHRLQLIKQFADLYRRRRVGDRAGGWTVEATRHRDALVALDLRRAGHSYREIATVLYGDAAVRERWSSPDQTMKNRVIRSVKRGLRMSAGDYRALLQ